MDDMPTRQLSVLAALALLLSACSGTSGGSGGDADPSDTESTPSSSSGMSWSSEDVIEATPPSPPSGDGLRPQPKDSFDDQPEAYENDCHTQEGTAVNTCEYGDDDGDVTVAVVGDSKALQWISAIDEIGQERGWHIVTMTKST